MSLAVSRAVIRRQQNFILRAGKRNASTTTEAVKDTASKAAGAAKDAVSAPASKAQEGLSKVTSSAGNAASRAGSMAANAVGGVGGRVGRLISFAQSLVPPTIYYSKVGLELGKMMFNGQKMNPPTGAHFQQYAQRALQYVRNPSAASNVAQKTAEQATQKASAVAEQAAQNPDAVMGSLRNMSSAQMAAAAVVVAEVLGFFSVGEMLGRFKIVGYRSSTQGQDHHDHH